MTTMLNLPPELLLHIASFLNTDQDIYALTQANHFLYSLLNPHLYTRNARMNNSTALLWAATTNNPTTASLSLQHGADPNALESDDTRTPLWIAARHGHTEIARLLLAHKDIEIEPHTTGFATPFAWAVVNGHEEIVRLLVATGRANVNARRVGGGRTLLGYAVSAGKEEVVRMLVEIAKVDVNVEAEEGVNVLGRAAMDGSEGIVRILLGGEGVEVNVQDWVGRTPLVAAAVFGKVGVVRMLVEDARVDVDARDGEGMTALAWAVRARHVEVVRVLLASGKALDVYTPLEEAVRGDATSLESELVQLLEEAKRASDARRDQ
ncbi:ankyrin repeat-containing domain protein [Aspergillus heterothallicus]